MPTFDPQAQKLFDKAEALKKQSDEIRAKAEAVLAKKYGQLGAIFADRANAYLPSKKKDWKPFIDRVMTIYEKSLDIEASEETADVEEAVEEVVEQQFEAAPADVDETFADSSAEETAAFIENDANVVDEAVVDADVEDIQESAPQQSPAHSGRPSGNYDDDDDILGRSRRPRQSSVGGFSGGLKMPDTW